MTKSICLGIIAGAMLHLYGCATVQLTTACPATSTGVSFALAGSTVGNQVLSMLGSMGSKAGLMAPVGAPAAPTNTATMSYSYIPIFGADSGSLTCLMPIQTTTVVTSPPASIVH